MVKVHDLPRVRIIGKGLYDAEVYLDDIDISKYVSKVSFVLDANDPHPLVELTVVALPDVPQELEAIVTATREEIE